MGSRKVVPYQKRYVMDKKKAVANTEKTTKPVAKDTNKTRRKNTLMPLANRMKSKGRGR
jgi:hypothetical protein